MQKPKWAREIERFISVKSQFILWGNIYDVYPYQKNDAVIPLSLTNYLSNLLGDNEYELIIQYEPLMGFSLLRGDEESFKKVTGHGLKDGHYQTTLIKSIDTIEKIVNNNEVYATVILNFSSRLNDIAGNDTHELYYRTFRLLQNASAKIIGESKSPKFNLLFWFIDKENDLPPWYSIDNPKIKVLPLPKPDFLIRKVIISKLSSKIRGFNEVEPQKQEDIIATFVDETNDLFANEILSIITLAIREKIEFSKIGEAIKMYKLGIVENEWAKISTKKILSANEELSKRVKGQSRAINKVSEILKRAYFNLSGAQYSKNSSRPKGVLFFAGATGVGKTELAKSITGLIFGSETNYIRFDMSEFSAAHADQRLLGAPPGYVGYEMGGELTNAIKQNPFSVILFDEIEKANPKILDIFLQILDDGRLTSGRGETVYFSEALIIFTSNLGIYDVTPSGEKVQKVNFNMSYEQMSQTIIDSIEEFFKYRLQRAEILNRIGKNIIVFDFIRKESAVEIFDKMVTTLFENIKENYDITVKMTKEAKEKLANLATEDLSMGGRGVGNELEEILVNPLSSLIFEMELKGGDAIGIYDVECQEGSCHLTAKKLSLVK
ncbi:MAG: ATP-dependent Clp protease ATP-binding subunit [Campylobacterales bacterium]|nr:ATP-dependent Clp protease ATP-binding subunit [Campylobacterales bacterium]